MEPMGATDKKVDGQNEFDNLVLFFQALQENYAAPVPDSDEPNIPTAQTANPPLPTNTDATSSETESKQETVNELSAEEQIAKGKLEAIIEAIEKTEFETTTGQWLGTQGGVKITTSTGAEKILSDTAHEIWKYIHEHNQSDFAATHLAVKAIARNALKTNWKNFFSNNLTRTTAAIQLYQDIADDKIQAKSVVLRC
jgi:hypothetical protein